MYILKNIPKLKTTKFKYNSLEVKCHFHKLENSSDYIMSVGVTLNTNTFENWFTKQIEFEDDKLVIRNIFIEHPPFRFFQKGLEKNSEGKVDLALFFDKIFEMASVIENESNISDAIIKDSQKKYVERNLADVEKLYYHCSYTCKTISKKQKDKIKHLIEKGDKVIKYLEDNQLNLRFTNDIHKARIFKFEEISNRTEK